MCIAAYCTPMQFNHWWDAVQWRCVKCPGWWSIGGHSCSGVEGWGQLALFVTAQQGTTDGKKWSRNKEEQRKAHHETKPCSLLKACWTRCHGKKRNCEERKDFDAVAKWIWLWTEQSWLLNKWSTVANVSRCIQIVMMMLWIWFTFCITKLLRTIASNALCNAVCSLRCEVFNASVNLLAQRWIERWNKQFTPQMKTTLVVADRQTDTYTVYYTRTWHQLLNYFAFSKWTTEIQILLRCPTWSGCPFGVASSPLTLAASPSMDPSSR